MHTLSDSMAAPIVTFGPELGPESGFIPLPRGEVSTEACGLGRYCGFLVSCMVHLCLLGILYFFGYGVEPRSVVYEVSLAGLPHAFSGQGGGETRGANEAIGVTRASGAGFVATGGTPVEASAPDKADRPEKVEKAPVSAETTPAPATPRVQKTTTSPKVRKPAAARATGATPRQPTPSSSSSSLSSSSSSSSFPVASSSQEAGQPSPSGQGEQNASQSAQSGQGGEGTVFSMHQVDTMPAVLRRATPVYPPEAKKQRIEGRVVVRLVVDAGGKATQCIVQTAEPQGYFEASALEAVGRMRFAPGKKAGQAVSTLVLLPFDFRLR